jgi:hypothetical protein
MTNNAAAQRFPYFIEGQTGGIRLATTVSKSGRFAAGAHQPLPGIRAARRDVQRGSHRGRVAPAGPDPARRAPAAEPDPLPYRRERDLGPRRDQPLLDAHAVPLGQRGTSARARFFDALGLQGEITQLSGDGVRVQVRAADACNALASFVRPGGHSALSDGLAATG